MLMTKAGATQGLIPIPKPIPIPESRRVPSPARIPRPIPIQAASVLPPLMGMAAVPIMPVAALAKPLVTGESTPPPQPGEKPESGARPQGVPPPRRRRSTGQRMGMPSPERFWRRTARVSTTLPKPEDYWWGAKTTSQIYLPTPEEFWKK